MKGKPAISTTVDDQAPSPPATTNRSVPGFRGFGGLSRLHTEEEYQAILRRLDLALGASHIGVWEHSLANHTVTWDQRMHRLYGTEPTTDAVPVDIWMNALHPDDRAAALADFERAVERKGSYRSEFRILLPDGRTRYIRSMANYFLDSRGLPGFIGAEWDVSADVELAQALAEQRRLAEERAAALQESQARIEFAADHDYLTGLPNRRLFDRLCRQLDEGSERKRLAVIQVDLDRFKEANDAFGHEAGDLVLKAAARAIRSVLGPQDVAARMGGDEFVIVCVDPQNEVDLGRRAQKLIERIGRGIQFSGELISTGASLGIAVAEDRPVSALLKEADAALYSAKRRGRGQAVFFSAALQAREPAYGHPSEIRAALDAGAIRPFYRCLRESRTENLVGLEAIAGWDHPRLGRIGLEDYLPELRDMGLLPTCEQHLVRALVDDLRFWQRLGFSLPRVSIVLSGEFFASPLLLEEVRRADRLAARLCFELRASDSLKDMTAATLKAATELKALGVQIAVSGLQDGEGSLIGLLRLRPDRLKLDRTMLAPSAEDLEQGRVLAAVGDFARAFGMTLIAEEGEAAELGTLLDEAGCLMLRGGRDGPLQDRASLPLTRLR